MTIKIPLDKHIKLIAAFKKWIINIHWGSTCRSFGFTTSLNYLYILKKSSNCLRIPTADNPWAQKTLKFSEKENHASKTTLHEQEKHKHVLSQVALTCRAQLPPRAGSLCTHTQSHEHRGCAPCQPQRRSQPTASTPCPRAQARAPLGPGAQMLGNLCPPQSEAWSCRLM